MSLDDAPWHTIPSTALGEEARWHDHEPLLRARLILVGTFHIGYGVRDGVGPRREIAILTDLGHHPVSGEDPRPRFRNQVRFELTPDEMVALVHHLWMLEDYPAPNARDNEGTGYDFLQSILATLNVALE